MSPSAPPLSPQQRETLAGIAQRHEVVFDGEVLDALRDRGLVKLVDSEWNATPAGLAALDAG